MTLNFHPLPGANSILSTPLSVGQAVHRKVVFDAESVKHFARLIGDPNPLHYDEELARASPYGKLIAAGAQSSSFLVGVVAECLCRIRPSLGLETSFTFHRAVLVDDPIYARWHIVSLRHSNRLAGEIVTIACELTSAEGTPLVKGKIVSLVRD